MTQHPKKSPAQAKIDRHRNGALRPPIPDDSPLTVREELFVDEYLIDFCATRAAIRAGYARGQSASQKAHEVLKRPRVQRDIRAAIAARKARVKVEADNVLRAVAKIAFSDPGDLFDLRHQMRHIKDLPEDIRLSIASIELDDKGRPKKIRLWNKGEALALLARHLGLDQKALPPPEEWRPTFIFPSLTFVDMGGKPMLPAAPIDVTPIPQTTTEVTPTS